MLPVRLFDETEWEAILKCRLDSEIACDPPGLCEDAVILLQGHLSKIGQGRGISQRRNTMEEDMVDVHSQFQQGLDQRVQFRRCPGGTVKLDSHRQTNLREDQRTLQRFVPGAWDASDLVEDSTACSPEADLDIKIERLEQLSDPAGQECSVGTDAPQRDSRAGNILADHLEFWVSQRFAAEEVDLLDTGSRNPVDDGKKRRWPGDAASSFLCQCNSSCR